MLKRGHFISEKLAYGCMIVILGAILMMGYFYLGGGQLGEFGKASVQLNNEGRTILKSADGFAVLLIPEGANSDAREVSIQKLNIPTEDARKASSVYEFSPSGSEFSKPLWLNIKYDAGAAKECPSQLNFYHFNEDGTPKEYVASRSINCGANTALFDIDGFSFGYAGIAARDEEQAKSGSYNSITGNAAGENSQIASEPRSPISIPKGGMQDPVRIIRGKSPYTIKSNSNPDVIKTGAAVGTPFPADYIYLTVLGAGTARLEIEDSSTPVQNLKIEITTAPYLVISPNPLEVPVGEERSASISVRPSNSAIQRSGRYKTTNYQSYRLLTEQPTFDTPDTLKIKGTADERQVGGTSTIEIQDTGNDQLSGQAVIKLVPKGTPSQPTTPQNPSTPSIEVYFPDTCIPNGKCIPVDPSNILTTDVFNFDVKATNPDSIKEAEAFIDGVSIKKWSPFNCGTNPCPTDNIRFSQFPAGSTHKYSAVARDSSKSEIAKSEKSFTVVGQPPQDVCGGIAGIKCQSGYDCEYNAVCAGKPDCSGVCRLTGTMPTNPNPTPPNAPTGQCGQGHYFNKLEGFDYNKFNDCSKKSPKYLAARVFSRYASPKVTSSVISDLNDAGLRAALVSGSKDVINFGVENVGRIDTIRDVGDNGIGKAWQWLPVGGPDNSEAQQTPTASSQDCNNPQGTVPQINSASPSTAGRSDTLSISGTGMTKTIQFYQGSSRFTYVGSVNGACTQTMLRVPADLPAGTYILNVYKAQNKISNGQSVTISGTATNENNPTTTTGTGPTYPSCVDEATGDAYSVRGVRAKDDVAIFAVCRDVVWMTRNTNTALGCSQDFTFNGIPAATWKSWVENEAKAVLDACKDVCHPGVDVGCVRQPPSVDKDKLIQALENYWKNCIHRKGISCVCNPSDPSCASFAPYISRGANNPTPTTPTGTTTPANPGTTINPYTPSNVWSPKLTNNGWFPHISPSGRYVTYGFGENWVVDLATGEERSFTMPNGQSFGGQWIKSDTYTFENTLSGASADRIEVKAGEWLAKKTNDDSSLVAGNTFVAAADGHWASWLASQNRIAYDNTALTTGYGVAIGEDGWVVDATSNEHTAIDVWHNRQKVASYVTQIPLQQWAVNKGHILYGGYGPVHGISPDGKDIDLTVTPWRGEGIGGIIFVDNKPWVYTSAWDNANNKGYTLIRPWGEKASIVIDGGAASLDVVYSNNEFVVASSGDKGQLKVIKVPANTQRVNLTN